MTIRQELQKPGIEAIVQLYILHMDQFSEPNFYFTPNTIDGLANLSFGGQVYLPIPVEAKGFGTKMSGAMPRPKIKISNITKFLVPYLAQYNGLIGVPVTRILTLERFLDSGSSPDSTQTLANQKFLIQSNTVNKLEVEFTLSSVLDVQNIKLPKGTVLRSIFPGAGLYRKQ